MHTPRWILAAMLGVFCTAPLGCESLLGGSDDDDELTTTTTGDRYDTRSGDRYDSRTNDRYDSRTSDRYDSRTSRTGRNSDGDVVIGSDRDGRSDRYDDGRTASWPDRSSGVPAGAQTVGQMDGGNIEYRARSDGRLYIYDNDDQRVVWSGRLRDDERFVLMPSQHEATINGQSVGLPKLGRGHGFTLYFLPEK